MAVGVPEITQVEASNVTPVGNAPPAVIEQVVVAPLLTTVGVIESAVPTVPETVIGEMLIVGNPGFTIRETLAELEPPEFVAVTV